MKDHQISELVNNINKRVRSVFHDAPHQLREIIRTVVVEYFHVNDRSQSFGGTLVTHKGQSLDQEDQIKELQNQLDKYKRLAKERGEFIFNGTELGYISEPESETDRAYYTFLRCQMTDEAAIKSV